MVLAHRGGDRRVTGGVGISRSISSCLK
jgi:hypothetical protein